MDFSAAGSETPRAPKNWRRKLFSPFSAASTRYEPRASFRTYLYAIAFKQVSGEWRRAKREARTVDSEPATQNDPGDGIWLRRAIEQLDDAHREVLLLREYEQLSYDEIAALLRIPVNTVRSRLFRARMELKALLSPERTEREGSKP